MDSSEFSFKTGTLTGGPPQAESAPTAEAPSENAPPPSVPARDSDPGLDVAYRWAKIYENDIEFEPFFEWVARRSNAERTDFRQILESIPEKFGPEDLPLPLRRFFREQMLASSEDHPRRQPLIL